MRSDLKKSIFNGTVICIGTLLNGTLGNVIVNSDNLIIMSMLWIIEVFIFNFVLSIIKE